MVIRITKKVDVSPIAVEVDVDLNDFDDDDLINELVSRDTGLELVIKIDEMSSDWSLTRKIRDWAVAEMEKHELVNE